VSSRIFIGTSGWNYAGWKESFYKGVPRKSWLEFYAEHFNALEVDGTFYRLMRPSVFEAWCERTPANFRFAIKGHRYVTHVKRLAPSAESIKLQRDNGAPLGEKLVAVLWQLPASLHKDLVKLERFATLLDIWPEVRHVIEFRDKSWFDDEVADLMARERLAVCQSDAATWPMWDAVTTDLVFVRLHGHTTTYASNYDTHSLKKWAQHAREWLDQGRDVHVYFDNDASGHAPLNALTLAEMLSVKSEPSKMHASRRGQAHVKKDGRSRSRGRP
jgi:uncharacterized protein YecE (DUF72 family)